MFNDIFDNFVIHFAKFSNISYDNSRFILLTESPQYFEYKLIISKKINDDFIENTDLISKDGEKFLVKCLNDEALELKTDNATILIKEKEKEKEKKKISKDDCIFEEIEDKKEVIIEKKIDDLLSKERNEKIVGIASATLPIFLATYLAKKTYQSFTKKD
jgi:hypothetical protein